MLKLKDLTNHVMITGSQKMKVKDIVNMINEILDNKFLNLKPLMKEKGLKMMYCINNNISYSEYRYLIEKENKGE
jgi:hypothetical protein